LMISKEHQGKCSLEEREDCNTPSPNHEYM